MRQSSARTRSPPRNAGHQSCTKATLVFETPAAAAGDAAARACEAGIGITPGMLPCLTVGSTRCPSVTPGELVTGWALVRLGLPLLRRRSSKYVFHSLQEHKTLEMSPPLRISTQAAYALSGLPGVSWSSM